MEKPSYNSYDNDKDKKISVPNFFEIKLKSKSLVTNPADSTIKHFLAPKFVANKIINTFPLNFPPLGDFL